jgi:hypothetical protein
MRHVAVVSRVGLDLEPAQQPRHYALLPDSIAPTSASLDRSRLRVVLGFDQDLRPGATYSLAATDLRDTTGAPLVFPVNRVLAPFSIGPTPLAPFDLNRNGAVDLEDFFLFAAAFGTSQPRPDFDGDGFVDFTDFFLFADAFGKHVAK